MSADALPDHDDCIAPVRGGARGALLNLFLRSFFKRPLGGKLDVEASVLRMRERLESVAARDKSVLDGVRYEPGEEGGVPVEWVEPQAAVGAATIVYFHGGGFVAGSPRTHRSITRALALAVGARVCVPDYRLAPEHRFPAALSDTLAVYRSLVARTAPGSVVVVGDSAGGNLVLATLLDARDGGAPMPAGAVAISPWSDLTGSGASIQTNARREAMLPAHKLAIAASVYAPADALQVPRVSPVFGDYRGFPPLLLHAGTTEILLDDSTRVVARARAAGVDVRLRLWRNLPHVFHAFAHYLPAARVALDEIAEFAREALGTAAARRT